MEGLDRFRLLTAVALVDGKLDPPEQEVLRRSAASLGLSPQEAQQVIQEMLAGGRLSNLTPPENPTERLRLFEELARVAKADGAVAPQERAVLERLAPSFGVTPAQLDLLLGGARTTGKLAGGAAAPPPLPAAASGAKAAPAAKRPARKPPQASPGTASCPSCGGPVEFKNARSVAVVCPYCDNTVTRTDKGGALADLGRISHVVEDASPIRIGASGSCFSTEFLVIGRLQVEYSVGVWNEWFLQWADRRSGWLGEALGQYFITFLEGGEGAKVDVPAFEKVSVGMRVVLGGKPFTVTEKNVARATGTEGETPFVVEGGYELPYADLRRTDAGFATIDYSEETPLVFSGRCVSWKDLGMRGHRRFHGW